jgi:hypothetical protein
MERDDIANCAHCGQPRPRCEAGATFSEGSDERLQRNLDYSAHSMLIDYDAMRAKLERDLLEIDRDTGWQANPSGLSGRVVRGWRHWRSKR